MSIHKYQIATFTVLLGLACAVGLTTSHAYAADPAIISMLDDIGQKHNINENDDVYLSFNVNNETEVEFTIKPLGTNGDIAFIYSDNPATGVNSLICRLSPKCRGKYLSSAIDSYVNAAYMFKITQQKNILPQKATEDINPLVDNGNLSAAINPANEQTASADSATPMVFEGIWYIGYGNAEQEISAYKNTSGKPIKAFRVTWGLLDDFDEVAIKRKTEYTASSTYLNDGAKSEGHVIQPGETIYYSMMNIGGIQEIGFFADHEGLLKELSIPKDKLNSYRIDKKHIFDIDKVIYADK